MGLTFAEAGGWPPILTKLMHGTDLTADEAAAALTEIFEGNASEAQIAAFITLIHAKGESVEELAAIVRTLLEFAEPIPITADIIDTCGTGGSMQRRRGALNVSTMASFVVAGAGAKVAKHGGRAASATSSSADLLEAMGVRVELGPAEVARCVEEAGMAFCFAPRFHPAARHVAPTRRQLGIPTVFNFVNPLANPARPRRQLVGVSNPQLAEKMLGVLQTNGAVRAMVVYGHDGLDELTTTTTSTIVELADGEVRTYVVDPAELGLPRARADELIGGDGGANAAIARHVLDGGEGPHRDVVLLNAAAGIVVAGLADDMTRGLALAVKSIDSGAAASVAERLVVASNAAAG